MLKVGLIGCGHISETYFRSQTYFNNINIVTCADINIEAANKCAQEYNIQAKNVDDLLADKEIDIILLTAKEVRRFGIKPVIALLSYSNFGSTRDIETKKLQRVVKFFHENHPNLLIDGEVQANFALNSEKMKEQFPHSKLNNGDVNTLIFPNLDSANITYKIIKELDRSVSVGPILIGLNKPIHILQLGASVDEIVNMAAVSVIDANQRKIKK